MAKLKLITLLLLTGLMLPQAKASPQGLFGQGQKTPATQAVPGKQTAQLNKGQMLEFKPAQKNRFQWSLPFKFQIFQQSGPVYLPDPPEGPDPAWYPEQRHALDIGLSQDGSAKIIRNIRWGFNAPSAEKLSDKMAWDPMFADTTVPLSGVKNVYMIIEPFKPTWLAAHAMLAFEFENGQGIKSANGQMDNGLVLSVEAALKRDQSYSLLKGFKHSFGQVYMLSSWNDIIQKVNYRAQHALQYYPLDLNQEQKDQLLQTALVEATKDRTGEFYHTTRNSCYQNCVRILDTVLTKKEYIRQWLIPRILYNPLATMPKFGPFRMRCAGLYKKGTMFEYLPVPIETQLKAAKGEPLLCPIAQSAAQSSL